MRFALFLLLVVSGCDDDVMGGGVCNDGHTTMINGVPCCSTLTKPGDPEPTGFCQPDDRCVDSAFSCRCESYRWLCGDPPFIRDLAMPISGD